MGSVWIEDHFDFTFSYAVLRLSSFEKQWGHSPQMVFYSQNEIQNSFQTDLELFCTWSEKIYCTWQKSFPFFWGLARRGICLWFDGQSVLAVGECHCSWAQVTTPSAVCCVYLFSRQFKLGFYWHITVGIRKEQVETFNEEELAIHIVLCNICAGCWGKASKAETLLMACICVYACKHVEHTSLDFC